MSISNGTFNLAPVVIILRIKCLTCSVYLLGHSTQRESWIILRILAPIQRLRNILPGLTMAVLMR